MCFGAHLVWGMKDGRWLMMLFAELRSLNVIGLESRTGVLDMELNIYSSEVII